jgi:hypothetical protein
MERGRRGEGAWPANRRVLYNRASADPAGNPWSERKQWIWWDGQQWTGYDVPDFTANKSPDAPAQPDGIGLDAHSGRNPFIMKPDGVGWLFDPTGLLDGPLPTHYEPAESPVHNQIYKQQTSPVLKYWQRDDNQLALELHVPAGWDEGYCPICGAWPTLTEVQGLERAHRWRCGRCGSGWGLAILRCPYCGEGNHQRLGSLTAEDGEARCSVNTCLTCGGYIKTRTTLHAIPACAVILEDLATVDWDLVALEHGYMRPTHTGYPLRVRLVAPPNRIRTFFGRRP